MSYELIEQLKKAIDQYRDDPQWEEAGTVVEVGDGVVRITGLMNVKVQEILAIETPASSVPAVALNLEEDTIGAIILGDETDIASGATVRLTGEVLSVAVSERMLGRIIDPLGRPLDGLGPIATPEHPGVTCPLERSAPSVLDREPVNTPLHTGIKAIDIMTPIGRGQRELIIGDRQTGKTAIALDAIINQQQDSGRANVVSVYVAIGQKESKIARLVATLKENGALDSSIIVAAPASSPAALWYLAPFTGCAIGEYFMDRGGDALVVYDDLSKHAWAYRQISLLLNRPPGREAYPGDIFYLHSRILERAAKLNATKGGGSLTALPIIETQLGDISAYIPTNVISITDGQIFLESDLFHQGIRPAINVGLSVSRVGSTAQTSAMKQYAGKLRLQLAQFRELQAFAQFASDMDESTRHQLQQGRIFTEVLKQDDLKPLPFEQQVVILYAALNGYFDDGAPTRIPFVQEKLLEHIRLLHRETVLAPLAKSGILDPDTERALKEALSAFDFTGA